MRRLDEAPKAEAGEALPGPKSKTLGARVPTELYERVHAFAAAIPTPTGAPGDVSPVVFATFASVFDPARIDAINAMPGDTFAARLAHCLDGGIAAEQLARALATPTEPVPTESTATEAPAEGADGG